MPKVFFIAKALLSQQKKLPQGYVFVVIKLDYLFGTNLTAEPCLSVKQLHRYVWLDVVVCFSSQYCHIISDKNETNPSLKHAKVTH